MFDKSQRDAMARLFLNLRGGGFDVAGIFWGLWLFPRKRVILPNSVIRHGQVGLNYLPW